MPGFREGFVVEVQIVGAATDLAVFDVVLLPALRGIDDDIVGLPAVGATVRGGLYFSGQHGG